VEPLCVAGGVRDATQLAAQLGTVALFEVTVPSAAKEIIRECRRRGLVVKLDTFERKRSARHWHLGFEGQPGVLEITDLGAETVLKVASNRDGGWATALARELAQLKTKKRR
jgi:hypothetical protein